MSAVMMAGGTGGGEGVIRLKMSKNRLSNSVASQLTEKALTKA